MNHLFHKHIACFILLYMLTFFLKEISAGTSVDDYDYSHRKRDCEVTLVSPDGALLTNAVIGISQISNDFVFGGAIRGEGFDTLGDDYGRNFQSYFDVATPENEMNWEEVMKCSEKCAPDFSKADSLVNWLRENNIPIRGHNLFRNEKEDWIPEWARNLDTAAFKQAMLERIATTMGHFKGKVAQWDLISGICHDEDGAVSGPGMLETKSGDPNIFSWIMDEAREIDADLDFVINDYDLITSSDQTTADQFINKVKPLSSKFEIVGAEGHFGADMDKSSYEPKINYLAEQFGKPVLLTDVDFAFDINQAPDKIEELMRTCFANPNVGGLIMGSWCNRYQRRSDLTSYFVDSLKKETPAGERWREVRDEWKTEVTGNTDESAKFTFNGFQGAYIIVVSCYRDTFYLEPGEGTENITIIFAGGTPVNYALAGPKKTEFIINGVAAPVMLPARYHRPLFLTTYSLSGQQLFRSPVNLTDGRRLVTPASSCCRVFRIETADRLQLYTGKIMADR